MALKQVGAAWLKTSKAGKEFVSISLDVVKMEVATPKDGKLSFLMFSNEKKEEGTKQPDYTIMTTVDEVAQ